jgi:sialic acid synthase
MNRAMKGTDHVFSLEPQGLEKMVRDLRRTRLALGDGTKRTYPSEYDPVMKMSKKIVAARDLPAGAVLATSDLALKSPGGDGMQPYELDGVIGATLRQPLAFDMPLTFEHIEVATLKQAPRPYEQLEGAQGLAV